MSERESPTVAPLRSIARESLAEQAAAALRDYIIANRLAAGTRLPAEPVLAAQLGVSRNVLRQAVASLQTMGFLRVTHGSGTFVADPADSDVFQQLAAWMGGKPISEEDYFEVRAIWERGVYELVMRHASDQDLESLESVAGRMESATGAEEAAALHDAYHEALLRVTGNEFLVTIGMILQRFFFEFVYRDAGARKPPEPRLWTSHREILRLLRLRDPATIPQMVELHLAPHLTSDEHRAATEAIG
ncbi:MAG: FadR family transcriptional regulator [Candidatus Dormibacteraeota bacterium]|nr:FadR family transcriptional regulator [Candidatus Dormibacteraeota bacterium]